MNTPITTPIDTQNAPERAPHGRARKGMRPAEDKALTAHEDKAIRPEETK